VCVDVCVCVCVCVCVQECVYLYACVRVNKFPRARVCTSVGVGVRVRELALMNIRELYIFKHCNYLWQKKRQMLYGTTPNPGW
jgi:hypothetical protein